MPTLTSIARYFTRTELNDVLDHLGLPYLDDDACPIRELSVPVMAGGKAGETALAVLAGDGRDLFAIALQLGTLITAEAAADLSTGALMVNDPQVYAHEPVLLFRGNHIV